MHWPLLLFLKSFPLPLDAIASFWIDRLFCSLLPFLFLTSLSTKELKLQCPSLNKHYQKKRIQKNELHKLCVSLNHHPSSFYWVIIHVKRFTFFSFFLMIIFFSSSLMFALCYGRFVYSCIYIYIYIVILTSWCSRRTWQREMVAFKQRRKKSEEKRLIFSPFII